MCECRIQQWWNYCFTYKYVIQSCNYGNMPAFFQNFHFSAYLGRMWVECMFNNTPVKHSHYLHYLQVSAGSFKSTILWLPPPDELSVESLLGWNSTKSRTQYVTSERRKSSIPASLIFIPYERLSRVINSDYLICFGV